MAEVLTFKGRQQSPPLPRRTSRVIMLGVSKGGVKTPPTIASYHLREVMKPSGIDWVVHPDIIVVRERATCSFGENPTLSKRPAAND